MALVALTTFGVLLTACGGASMGTEEPPARQRLAQADMRPLALSVPTVSELFNWAESQYPSLFPSGPINQLISFNGVIYDVRAYSLTENYLGVAAGVVYGYGNFTNWELQSFGELSSYTCQVNPSLCGDARPAQPTLAIGLFHQLVLTNDGAVFGWGDNTYAQIGPGIRAQDLPPRVIVRGAKSIVATDNASYALMADGTVTGWGLLWNHRLADFDSVVGQPTTIPGLTEVDRIFAFDGRLLVAVHSDGSLSVYPGRVQHQLDFTQSALPLRVPQFPRVKSVELYGSTFEDDIKAVVITSDGYAWDVTFLARSEFPAALGEIKDIREVVFEQIQGLREIVSASCGAEHCLFLSETGEVYARGRGSSNQLGIPGTLFASIPVRIDTLSDIKAIDALRYASYALTRDGRLFAWGHDIAVGSSEAPQQIRDRSDIKEFVLGNGDRGLARTENDELWGWGVTPGLTGFFFLRIPEVTF